MNVTKRQQKLRDWFVAYAKQSNQPLPDLAPEFLRTGITKLALMKLEGDVPCTNSELECFEKVHTARGGTETAGVRELVGQAVQAGYSKTAIAEAVGVSPVTLSRWISGKYNPSTDNLEVLTATVKKLVDKPEEAPES